MKRPRRKFYSLNIYSTWLSSCYGLFCISNPCLHTLNSMTHLGISGEDVIFVLMIYANVEHKNNFFEKWKEGKERRGRRERGKEEKKEEERKVIIDSMTHEPLSTYGIKKFWGFILKLSVKWIVLSEVKSLIEE